MATFPLNVESKGQNNRKVSIADAAKEMVTYGEVNIARAHKKPTTLYADKKKTQPLAVLTPSSKKTTVTLQIQGPGGEALGSLVIEGGFTTREFEMFDAMGNSVGRISGEGVGREMAGMAIGGLAGRAIGGRASYTVAMQGGATVEIARSGGRKAEINMLDGMLTADHERILLPSLVMWAAYALS